MASARSRRMSARSSRTPEAAGRIRWYVTVLMVAVTLGHRDGDGDLALVALKNVLWI